MDFFTTDGWGGAMQQADMSVAEMGKILTEIATSTKSPPFARLAALKMIDEKNRAVLRAARMLRTVRGREIVNIDPEDGTSGTRILEVEGEEMSSAVDEVERRLRSVKLLTAGTDQDGGDDDDDGFDIS